MELAIVFGFDVVVDDVLHLVQYLHDSQRAWRLLLRPEIARRFRVDGLWLGSGILKSALRLVMVDKSSLYGMHFFVSNRILL